MRGAAIAATLRLRIEETNPIRREPLSRRAEKTALNSSGLKR
jgi:hypothetical protein